jgi:predicted metalloprotease with PDZ domain
MPEPWTHLFEVELAVSGLAPDVPYTDLRLPVWRSGRYAILDFAGGVVRFAASGAREEPLQWEKTDKATWRVMKGTRTALNVRYTIHANDFENRTKGLNNDHGFIDGSALFLYVEELRTRPAEVTIEPPMGWHVTTGLDSIPGARNRFTSPGYDDLIDCPIEIGTQRDFAFSVEGIPHVLSISGTLNGNVDSLIADASRIVAMNRRFWGALPYRRYVILIHAWSADGGGGTEHLNSTILSMQSDPSAGMQSARGFRGLFGHEFFHTWNVKQLRPRGMDPYDWTKENYYRELWIAEGSTSYLHNLLQVREGMVTAGDYLAGVAGSISADRSRPGNRVQSVVDASFDAWVKYARYNPDDVNFEADIYGKGAQVSLCLDLELRQRSGNAHGFDDLLRTLLQRYPRGSGGYTVEDVERIAGELAGGSMRDFFASYVFGCEPLPWERVLTFAGVRVDTVQKVRAPYLGIATGGEDGRVRVRSVVAESPAYRAGVNAGDEIVALDGFRVSSAQLVGRIRGYALGQTVSVTLFRSDRLQTIPILLDAPEPATYTLQRVQNPTSLQRAIYERWLGVSW